MITAEDIASYNDHGYIIKENVIDNSTLDSALLNTKSGGNPLDKWKYGKVNGISKLASYEPIINILRDLYGLEPFPFQTLNFDRSPGINIHSDTIHFHTDPPGLMCGVWVALEDVTPENGPLVYYPGSHLTQVITLESLGLVPSMDLWLSNLGAYSMFLAEHSEHMRFETLICKRGTMLIWDANLMHRSIHPRDGTTRASQVTHYYFHTEGVKYLVPAYGKNCIKNEVFRFADFLNFWI